MKMIKPQNETGMTLIELLLVATILATLVLVAVVPYLKNSYTVHWEMSDRKSEVWQNARIAMDKMVREIKQSRGLNDVSEPTEINGYIDFADKNDNNMTFSRYYDNTEGGYYLGYGPPDISPPSSLGGPIDSLRFICYREDAFTQTTEPNEIRSVEIELTVSDSEGKVPPITLISRVFLRSDISSSLFVWAIFGSEEVKVTGSASIDSYNSDEGLYETQIAGENGNVRSNGDIRVIGSATILGDATPGPEGEVRITGSAYITGSTEPAPRLVNLPPLDIEFPFPPSGQLKKTGSGTHTLIDGVYCFTDIKFTGSYQLITEDDVTIYCESVSFTGSSKITVNGKLTFYCTGDFKSTGGGIVNTSKKPEDFILYCTGEDIKLTGSSDFYGAAYLPNGDVTITGGHDYYGSIVAGGKVTGTGSCQIHRDEALASVVGEIHF